MLQIERKNKIIDILQEKNIIKISELLKKFPDISKMTLWRDIKKLSSEGIIERLHGGIMLKATPTSMHEDNFFKRLNEHKNIKRILANRAKKLVKPGDTIILDSSSTSYYMAEALINIKNIKIITNNIKIANDLNFTEYSEVILPGGVLKKETFSLVGPTTISFFKEVVADWFFFSVAGISIEKGALDINILETEVKKSMLKSARKSCIIFDASKFTERGNYPITDFTNITYCVFEKNKKLKNLNNFFKKKKISVV